MKLILSSEALPGAPPADLMQAVARRALAGLELGAAEGAGDSARWEGVAVPWLRLGEMPVTAALVESAQRLGAGLLVAAPVEAVPVDVPVAFLHGSDPAHTAQAVAWAQAQGARTAWEVAPGALDAAAAAATLQQTWPTLVHVRLVGAGPENEENEGLGSLLTRLALDGYAGTITLAPSPGADRARWATWLFQTRGWGCGSAAEKQGRTRDVEILQ